MYEFCVISSCNLHTCVCILTIVDMVWDFPYQGPSTCYVSNTRNKSKRPKRCKRGYLYMLYFIPFIEINFFSLNLGMFSDTVPLIRLQLSLKWFGSFYSYSINKNTLPLTGHVNYIKLHWYVYFKIIIVFISVYYTLCLKFVKSSFYMFSTVVLYYIFFFFITFKRRQKTSLKRKS